MEVSVAETKTTNQRGQTETMEKEGTDRENGIKGRDKIEILKKRQEKNVREGREKNLRGGREKKSHEREKKNSGEGKRSQDGKNLRGGKKI